MFPRPTLRSVVRVWVGVAALVTLSLALLVVLTVALIYTVTTYAIWVVERREVGWLPSTRGDPVLKDLHRVVLDELFSSGLLFLLHPFGTLDPAPPARRELLGRRPILMIHGYAQARSNFWLLGPRLMAAGLGPLYAMNLKPMSAGVVGHAEAVSRRIDEIMQATGAREIDVVAHSMGGVVARLAVADGRRRVRRLVTIGTPHWGTRTAELALGRSGHDLCVGAEALSRLPAPPRGMIVAISSTHDAVVVPPENARIGQLGRDVVVEGVGHLAMLLNERVAKEVAKALGEDILTKEQVLKPVAAESPASAVRV